MKGFLKECSLLEACILTDMHSFYGFRDFFFYILPLVVCPCVLQKDNIRNQREHVVLTLANTQSRLGIPVEADPVSAFIRFT